VDKVETVLTILQQIGGPYLVLGAGIFWLLERTGVVKSWLARRERNRTERLAEQAALTATYRQEAEDLRRWRIEDGKRHEEELRELEERLGARIDEERERADTAMRALLDEQRSVSRLRHLINNVGMFIYRLQMLLTQHGIEVPRFNWTQFETEGGSRQEFNLEI